MVNSGENMVPEMLILVNEQDQEIGEDEKLCVHQTGKLHRAFSIFIFRLKNNQQELLLQQRNKNKYHCGGLWTNTCCGHPRAGEDLMPAAMRRLREEMCFQTMLVPIDSFHYFANCNNGLIEHELDHVLAGVYEKELTKVNAEEVQDFRWIGLAELEQELAAKSETFTPWFATAFVVIKKWLINDNLKRLTVS